MKLIRLTAILALMAVCAAVNAQETNAQPSATEQSYDNTTYVGMQYDELMFQVPQGMKVERGESLTALYSDGTFGFTMQTVNQPSTKKISFELCERLADSLGLPRALVKKTNFGDAKGAQAQGMVDGMHVFCIVLAYDKHQVLITLMAKPERADWINRFLSTLKKG